MMESMPTHPNRECKMAFHVEHRPRFLLVAIERAASFDQVPQIPEFKIEVSQ